MKKGTKVHRPPKPGQSMQDLYPQVAAEADGWDPSYYRPYINKVMPWKCDRGHRWSAAAANRTAKGYGCPICSGQQLLAGFNDLATTDPELAAQVVSPDPSTFQASSARQVVWRCSLGHEWSAVAYSRVNGNGCPYCANKAVLPGFNDLATVYPKVAADADGWDPSTVIPGSHARKAWICGEGHPWVATVKDRAYGNTGCPYCSGQEVWPGFNDLATTHPDLAAQGVGWDPTKISAGSEAKRRWRCTQGHTWTASVGHRVRGQGCPTCAKHGFDPNAATFIYLAERPGEQQVGITADISERERFHGRHGWALREVVGPMLGSRAAQIELEVRRYLKRHGFVLPGSKENWSTADLEVSTLGELFAVVEVGDPVDGPPEGSLSGH